ncbi:predicted protein [Nematostella vectensis]|uniref:G-protein coupled receptors family 1 profile domain-containing protein n=1 Tax=Nematostella vectensis TaxID=45351 RepID=A7SFD2_NEMVE|nr:octopamine receptor beta-1R [Nematostella vectensis]EDO37604.1 predicted protein [Nematostella vectensis]|eukprot:XP_001629667.1 predicted protein [Nematostella vectensis]
MAALFGENAQLLNISIEEVYAQIENVIYSLHFGEIIGIITITTLPFTVLANALILISFCWDHFKEIRRRPSNLFVASLALTDVLVGLAGPLRSLFVLPGFKPYRRTGGAVVHVLGNMLLTTSAMHVLFLSLDRCVAITWPLSYNTRVTRRRVAVSIAVIWMYCISLAVLQLTLCEHLFILNSIFIANINLVAFGITLLFLVAVYSLKKHHNVVLGGNQKPCDNHLLVIRKRERNFTRTFTALQVVFKVCYLPMVFVWTLLFICSTCSPTILVGFLAVSIVLVNINSCLNPWLYAYRMPKFKKMIRLVRTRIFHACRLKNSVQTQKDITANKLSSQIETKL